MLHRQHIGDYSSITLKTVKEQSLHSKQIEKYFLTVYTNKRNLLTFLTKLR